MNAIATSVTNYKNITLKSVFMSCSNVNEAECNNRIKKSLKAERDIAFILIEQEQKMQNTNLSSTILFGNSLKVKEGRMSFTVLFVSVQSVNT